MLCSEITQTNISEYQTNCDLITECLNRRHRARIFRGGRKLEYRLPFGHSQTSVVCFIQ